jgi:RNA polymerase sigma-70 factor (ECF subfamily)
VEDTSDLSLLAKLRQGDPAALESFMERYASLVYRIALGITRNAADAEEVVQDTFLTLYQKADTFEGRAAFRSWLHRVVSNAALMKRRGRRHNVEVSLESQLPQFHPDGRRVGDQTWLLADWSQNPENELLSLEMRTLLDRAVDALPEQYRAVLLLRDVEGLSCNEVAEAVGDSVSAVKSRLHRARMTLREEFTRRLGPDQKRGWLGKMGKKLGLWTR